MWISSKVALIWKALNTKIVKYILAGYQSKQTYSYFLASRVDFGAKCYTYNELVGLDVGVRGRRISTRQLSRQMSPHIHTWALKRDVMNIFDYFVKYINAFSRSLQNMECGHNSKLFYLLFLKYFHYKMSYFKVSYLSLLFCPLLAFSPCIQNCCTNTLHALSDLQ